MKKLRYLVAVAGIAGMLLTSQVTGCSNPKESAYQKANYNESEIVTNVIALKQLEDIINSNKYVAVDVGATWCGPCRKYAPVFEAVAKDYEGKVVFCKVVLDQVTEEENKKISDKYQVMYIPKTMLFKHGKEVHSRIGGMDKNILSELVETWLLGDGEKAKE